VDKSEGRKEERTGFLKINKLVMKKELKNQLKAYGFQKEVNHYYKIIGDYRFSLGCELVDLEATEIISGKVHPFGFIKTFAQIAEEIRGLTGATPTPRQTKRQEIDTLRESVKMLDKENHEMGVYIAKNEKENQELGKRIDVLEKDKTFRAIGGIKDLMDQAVSMAFPKGGVSSATVHEGETILGKNIANTTKAEPKSEPEKTEGGFKVGDSVVLVKDPEFNWSDWFRQLAEDEVVQRIESLDNTRALLRSPEGNVYDDTFLLSELQHAPKAFKVGDPVETFYSVGKAGQRVLIVSQSDLDNEPLCTTKAPKEAAKVLEFGDPVEVILNSPELIEGHKLMFLKFLDDENLECECIDINTDHYEVEVSHLKAL
jgi:hypothetical protein